MGRNLPEIVDSEHTNVEFANQKRSHNFDGLGIVNQMMQKREVLFDVEKDECSENGEFKLNGIWRCDSHRISVKERRCD
jgi:hypothetical protein